MRTLQQIIEKDPQDRTETEKAVQAAFWAGQEEMRGRIVRGLHARAQGFAFGRYWRSQKNAIATMLSDGLLGGEGRDDSQEFLSWDFEV